MGKLSLANHEIEQLIKAFGADTQAIKYDQQALQVAVGPFQLEVREIGTEFHLEHNGVQFQCRARYRDGRLELDFE